MHIAAARLAGSAVQGLGHVDILVNNAGGSRSFTDLHVSEERWQEAMTLNFHRPRQVADALIDGMIARGWGRIINITGKSEPEHVNGAFCAKAGIHSWAKGLSRMVGKHGITVNAIAPTVFRSPLTAWMFEDTNKAKAVREGFLARVPLGRLGEPEDLAGPLLFLCSRASDFHTGHTVYADGGYTAG